MQDEFLSEEDLDLENLSKDELEAYWEIWFCQAQATNHLDYNRYSHGVFMDTTDPAAEPPEPVGRLLPTPGPRRATGDSR